MSEYASSNLPHDDMLDFSNLDQNDAIDELAEQLLSKSAAEITVIENPTPGVYTTLADRSKYVHDALGSIAYLNKVDGARKIANTSSHPRNGKVLNRIDGMESHAAEHKEKLGLALDAILAKQALREAGFDASQIRTATDEVMLALTPGYSTGRKGSRNRQEMRKKVSATAERSRAF